MQIFIIGNIASGKSTLAKQIAKIYGINYFSIDEIRKKINLSGDFSGEEMSWTTFKKIAQVTDNIIIESTGTSKHFESLMSLSRWPRIIIKVDVSVEKCLKNYHKRSENQYNYVPLPYDFNIEKSLKRNQTILNSMIADIHYGKVWNFDDLRNYLDAVLIK